MAKTMTARFTSECALGDGKVRKGDTIVYDGRAWHPACYSGSDRDNAEYMKGYNRAGHLRDVGRFFGEEAMAAEELAWELKDPDY